MTAPRNGAESSRAWQTCRFVLGIAQMAMATVSAILLVVHGVSTASLFAAVMTCALTTLSVLVFGRSSKLR